MMSFIVSIMFTGCVSGSPLNVRNNNPCNIKYVKENDWKGSVYQSGNYEKFSSKYYGLRACKIVVKANIRQTKNLEHFVLRFATEEGESLEDRHIRNYYRGLRNTLGHGESIRFEDIDKVVSKIIYLEGGHEATLYYK